MQTVAEVIAEMKKSLEDRRKLQDSLERARNAGAATGGAMDGLPRAKPRESRVEKYGTLAASIAEEIASVERMLIGDWEKVRKPIDAIQNVVVKKALTLRYKDLLPVSRIALEVGYSCRHTYRVMDEAIKNLSHDVT